MKEVRLATLLYYLWCCVLYYETVVLYTTRQSCYIQDSRAVYKIQLCYMLQDICAIYYKTVMLYTTRQLCYIPQYICAIYYKTTALYTVLQDTCAICYKTVWSYRSSLTSLCAVNALQGCYPLPLSPIHTGVMVWCSVVSDSARNRLICLPPFCLPESRWERLRRSLYLFSECQKITCSNSFHKSSIFPPACLHSLAGCLRLGAGRV